jgi:hypothetical protein
MAVVLAPLLQAAIIDRLIKGAEKYNSIECFKKIWRFINAKACITILKNNKHSN